MPRTAVKTQSYTGKESAISFETPFQKLTSDTFFRFAREYPKQEGVSTYVYQLFPKINRRKVGIDVNNIGTYKEPVTEQSLLMTHGSGRYLLKFSDANAPRGTTERAQATVEVYDPDIPNKIDPAELVLDDEKSRPWLDELRARGILKGESVVVQQNGNEAVVALADLTRKIFDERDKKGGIEKELTPIILKLLDRNSIDDAFKIAQQLKPNTVHLTTF